jgi:GH24 family phage-related lysozyme (muramidase)
VPPGLIVDGLLLKVPITGTCPTGGVICDAGGRTVTQPGMRITNDNNDKARKINLFNVVTSKNLLPATLTRPQSVVLLTVVLNFLYVSQIL